MNFVKRMGLLVLYTIGMSMGFEANAMLEKKTYGSKHSHKSLTLENPPQTSLTFKRLETKTVEKENTLAQRKHTVQQVKTARAFAEVNERIKCADAFEMEIEEVDPVADRRKMQKETMERERHAENVINREKRKKAREQAARQKAEKEQQEKQAALAKKIQEEKNREYEEDRRAVMIATQEAHINRAKRREARRKEDELNPVPMQEFKSKYAQNLMALSDGKALKNAYSALFMQIAEGNYQAAIPYIKYEQFSDCPNILALEVIGTAGEMVYEPQVVYEQLHRNVAKIGAYFPEDHLDECALYFAQKAGNKKYLAFAQSLNKSPK